MPPAQMNAQHRVPRSNRSAGWPGQSAAYGPARARWTFSREHSTISREQKRTIVRIQQSYASGHVALASSGFLMKLKRFAQVRRTFSRLHRAIMLFLRTSLEAKLWGISLLALVLCINGMNVVNSFVLRNFMSAIQDKNQSGFIRFAWLYAGVFAASTVAGVLFRFCEERLGLLWRAWMTGGLTDLYMVKRAYLLRQEEGALSNPDQRLTEDVRSLTTTTLSFMLMILNSSVTAVAFSGVLWNISPRLFGVAVAYAIIGSGLTILLGRPLVKLNYRQSDYEANFRAELVRVREMADGIALSGYEARCRERLANRLQLLILNLRRIIGVNRNLGFFTTGYNYMIQLIPTLIVAPLFIRGEVDFGVIGQSAMAFSTLVAAFSLVISQFQSISVYATVITRLNEFAAQVNKEDAGELPVGIQYETASELALRDLTLFTENGEHKTLLTDLTAEVPPETRLLVHGSGQAGMTALFRAIAGLPIKGSGTIQRPPAEKTAFLPENPYLPSGSLRDVLVTNTKHRTVSDEEILMALREVGLEDVMNGHGGLGARHNWHEVLSFREERLLSFARILLSGAEFVILDRPGSALTDVEVAQMLQLMQKRGMTCISLGDMMPHPACHDASLEIRENGTWQWREVT